jgi:hypothetical protein
MTERCKNCRFVAIPFAYITAFVTFHGKDGKISKKSVKIHKVSGFFRAPFGAEIYIHYGSKNIKAMKPCKKP